ncbi:MAG: 1-deoxy-D-xylulose-5-phosphate synthase [Clostridia bacterium]|nr:1-deoxy-D-xylulose-5-phosphate synthase [Clostridia bacterium]
MQLLDSVISAEDLKNLSVDQLYKLSDEMREFLIKHISETGGHLASNLGVVEMMLCIHKIFDTSKDRLVLDVGHQCYVHKMLTGRRDGFDNLRQYGGMAGFLRPDESVHDACVSGHASNSVSVALGMARARTLKREDYSVIAVIGDGALTGGLAYEALNDAGQSGEPLIIILNDNEMSITENVGAMTNHLSKLRLKPRYLYFKDKYRKFMKKAPGGMAVDKVIHSVKNSFKRAFLPSSFFENMGFTYLGPSDGHDIKYTLYLLELARDLARPVIIHLTTKKGKGYKYSEENPQDFHGVSCFDIGSGTPVKKGGKSFSSVFGEKLVSLAEKDARICAITAAMQTGVGLSGFAEKYKERFFDVGIAEGHAVALSAGLSRAGMVPVCAIYSTFLQRAYDMLIHDVAISKEHVIFGVDRAGLVGEDGETHQGSFDVAYLSSIPNMQILAPSDFAELEAMLEYAVCEMDGPVAIRYGRGGEGKFKENSFENASLSVKMKDGDKVTLVTYGTMINEVIAASEKCEGCEVIKLNSLAPLDLSCVIESVKKTGRIIVCEDVCNKGCIGEKIAATIAKEGISAKVILANTGDDFVSHGAVSKLYEQCGIDADSILKKILEA